MMYKEDVKELRLKLTSHVATINLLLMTQTVESICAAESDRASFASGFESNIMAHRRLLEQIKDGNGACLAHQLETKLRLDDQGIALDGLQEKARETLSQ